MGMATHVAWVLPASESAVTRARRVLSRVAPLSSPELIVARWHSPGAPMRRAARPRRGAQRTARADAPSARPRRQPGARRVAAEAAFTLQAIGGLLRAMRSAHTHQPMTRTAAAVMAYLLAVAVACAAITPGHLRRASRDACFVSISPASPTTRPRPPASGFTTRGSSWASPSSLPARISSSATSPRHASSERSYGHVTARCSGGRPGSAALAGVLTGAYGLAQIRAFLPQGPVELTAWALLIALYVQVRRQRVGAWRAVCQLALILLILAAAAVLELWLGA